MLIAGAHFKLVTSKLNAVSLGSKNTEDMRDVSVLPSY